MSVGQAPDVGGHRHSSGQRGAELLAATVDAGLPGHKMVSPTGPGGAVRRPSVESTPRMGGIALKNGLVLVSDDYWAAAIGETDGSISVSSGRKTRLPSGVSQQEDGRDRNGSEVRIRQGSRRLRLPRKRPTCKACRCCAAWPASPRPFLSLPRSRSGCLRPNCPSTAGVLPQRWRPPTLRHPRCGGGTPVQDRSGDRGCTRGLRPCGPVAEELDHLRVPRSRAQGHRRTRSRVAPAHRTARIYGGIRCRAGSIGGGVCPEGARPLRFQLVGPLLFTTIAANALIRGKSGRMSPVGSVVAGAVSLGAALEALRWATKHGDSLAAKVLMSPGRMIQKTLTTSEPTPQQLEVAQRAMKELLRLEAAGVEPVVSVVAAGLYRLQQGIQLEVAILWCMRVAAAPVGAQAGVRRPVNHAPLPLRSGTSLRCLCSVMPGAADRKRWPAGRATASRYSISCSAVRARLSLGLMPSGSQLLGKAGGKNPGR